MSWDTALAERYLAGFDQAVHPRAPDGMFTKGGGDPGGAGSGVTVSTSVSSVNPRDITWSLKSTNLELQAATVGDENTEVRVGWLGMRTEGVPRPGASETPHPKEMLPLLRRFLGEVRAYPTSSRCP